jgi:Flp pilus assembly protein TadD
VATFLYQQANKLAPGEDHYYLFLGRSYLEQAKITQATADQDKLVLQAESDLKVAQSINPLNTDHTANLARLFTWWAGKATSTDLRSQRAQKASDYYSTAVELSPNNSTLWDEWAILYMQLLGQPDLALQRLQHALGLDAKYNLTQGLLGDYYVKVANYSADTTTKLQALQTASEYYQTAADVTKYTDTNSEASYLVSLSNVYVQMAGLIPDIAKNGQLQGVINVLEKSIQAGLSSNDLWKVQEALAKLYLQIGDKANAQYYASQALIGAPATATNRIQDLITQTQSLP